MRVAVYNQMFGMNGKNILSYLYAHYLVHFQSNINKIRKATQIDSTISIIRESKSDIVGVCEVLEGQEKELREKLKKEGYTYIYFGDGHKTRFNKLRIKVALVSKIKCNNLSMTKFPVINELGGGGGVVCCYFPSQKLHVLVVHFALTQKKDLMNEQLIFINNYLRKLKGRLILMGDFNKTHSKVKEYFKDLVLLSAGIKSCRIMSTFNCRDLDHIFSRSFKLKANGFLEGKSDHRLVYVDLE